MMLLAGLTALFGFAGFAMAGEQGMVIALVVACAMNLIAYWNSDKMVLAMYGAKQVNSHNASDLFSITEHLSRRANIPMPKLYIIENSQPNAFATGRNPEHGAVAVTTGLLQYLDDAEVEGVIAHELAHIKNRDTLIMTITATIAGAISMLANVAMFFGGGRDRHMGPITIILMAILAPFAAMLVQMAISRTREYEADKTGAEISGNPMALASALSKIAGMSKKVPNHIAENNPATAHMFIMNPLNAHKIDNLFSTHPNPENRIARLKELALSSYRTT